MGTQCDSRCSVVLQRIGLPGFLADGDFLPGREKGADRECPGTKGNDFGEKRNGTEEGSQPANGRRKCIELFASVSLE